MSSRRAKFKRADPAAIRHRITERDLAVISAVERYRLLPSSLLVPLVAGNEDVTYRHLRNLYDLGLVNRFILPRSVGPAGEFIYYLDSSDSLELLAERQGCAVSRDARECVWRNREKAYCDLLDPSKAALRRGVTFYIEHELMISRFHAALELGCRKSGGNIVLARWQQGAELWDTVEAPKPSYNPDTKAWYFDGEKERLPHRPDAFFSLELPRSPEGERRANFFYEADRSTTSSETFRNKLRAYFHYIAREQRHRAAYGINRVRAVLIETLNRPRANQLHGVARHPAVIGPKPSPLFWFTLSELLTRKEAVAGKGDSERLPRYLVRPEAVMERIWVPSAGSGATSLLD